MVAKDRSGARDSPNAKAEVGEIDTRAPFQSVKDAVTLFGEGAFSGERPAIRKPKPYSAEVNNFFYFLFFTDTACIRSREGKKKVILHQYEWDSYKCVSFIHFIAISLGFY